MGKYMKGTQEMLDAAKNDATLLPFDTVFVTANKSNSFEEAGVKVVRAKHKDFDQDDVVSVRLSPASTHISGEDACYIEIKDLLPAKKSKQKKWQNGTQAQLDAAKDDARRLPKKTYFLSKRGNTIGMSVYRIDNRYNDAISVLMSSGTQSAPDFHCAEDLEQIND